jgi:hypothetical protein
MKNLIQTWNYTNLVTYYGGTQESHPASSSKSPNSLGSLLVLTADHVSLLRNGITDVSKLFQTPAPAAKVAVQLSELEII